MRITFGIHQGKTVKSLDTDKLQSFSNWLDEHPIGKDAPVKWRLERAHLVSAINRELATRDDEVEDDEAEALDGPTPLGRLLTSGETRVFLGLLVLLRRNEGRQPFPASFEACAEVMGGSKRSWVSAREKLIHHGYLSSTSRGELMFHDPKSGTTSAPYPGDVVLLLVSLVGLDSKEALYSGTVPTVYATVDQALEILGAQNSVDEVFKAEARKKLRKLLSGSRGYTVRDAIAVAQWGRRLYDTGEERWHKMVDLQYLWNPTHFAAALIAAQSAPAKKAGFTIMDTPEGAAEMDAEWMATLKRKGLI